MKTIVLLYNTSCIYEIVILNYFLKFTNKNVEFVSVDGKEITSMEGYSTNASGKLSEVDAGNVELLVVPGGSIKEIDNAQVWNFLKTVQSHDGIIAGICLPMKKTCRKPSPSGEIIRGCSDLQMPDISLHLYG